MLQLEHLEMVDTNKVAFHWNLCFLEEMCPGIMGHSIIFLEV